MYEEFTNLFGDVNKRIEDGNIIIEGDVNINIIEHKDEKEDSQDEKKSIGKKKIKSLRNSAAMTTWRKKIRSRDQGDCQCCREAVPEGLEVHHIFPLAKYPELGTKEENGIGLCQKCHSKYHQMYQGSEGPETFAKFLRDYGNRRY